MFFRCRKIDTIDKLKKLAQRPGSMPVILNCTLVVLTEQPIEEGKIAGLLSISQ
jgi:hypothetical protein